MTNEAHRQSRAGKSMSDLLVGCPVTSVINPGAINEEGKDMNKKLIAVLCQTHDKKPLASIDGMPGAISADLTPTQLRALAATLVRIADDAEARPMGPRTYRRCQREYVLTPEPNGTSAQPERGRQYYDRTTGRVVYVPKAARVKA